MGSLAYCAAVDPSRIYPLRNPRKEKDWGSRQAIPRFLGEPDAPEPVGELWMGAYPGAASRLVAPGGAELVGDSPREQAQRVDLVERNGGLYVGHHRGRRLTARPADHHLSIEPGLLDPRRERARQCACGKRRGSIESAGAATAVTLHDD